MNIYAGNLSYKITEDDLRAAFEAYGSVETATIIKDKYSGQSKGFGFVTMNSKEEALAAIEGLNKTELQGRTVNINEARPRSESNNGNNRNNNNNNRRRNSY